MNYNLALPFSLRSGENPSAPAISASGVEYSYGEFAVQVRKIAAWLGQSENPPRRVGILGSRSIFSCAAVLGSSWVGAAYIPLGLKWPEERILRVLGLSDLDAVICDEAGAAMLSETLLRAFPKKVLVPAKRASNIAAIDSFYDLYAEILEPTAQVEADGVAYIEFTSGTTGTPKGVVIPAKGVHRYISVMLDRYGVTTDDRIAETSDLTFDISVSNMFTAWSAGASLHIIPHSKAMAPINFIQEHRITLWYSVPSVIAFFLKMNLLKAGVFPSLRVSIFAGEPLPVGHALLWQEAAPGSVVDNFYGPTEATVICMAQRLTHPPVITPERQFVAIGTPFAGSRTAIVDENLQFLADGQPGEIALAGEQLALGYLGDETLSAARFPRIGSERWYLTGDVGYRDTAGIFHCLGRIDHQVKIFGHRIELEEIEAHLRALGETDQAAVIAWPITEGVASGLIAFIVGEDANLRERLKHHVPPYMVPSRIFALDGLPYTANGKVDRKALAAKAASLHAL